MTTTSALLATMQADFDKRVEEARRAVEEFWMSAVNAHKDDVPALIFPMLHVGATVAWIEIMGDAVWSTEEDEHVETEDPNADAPLVPVALILRREFLKRAEQVQKTAEYVRNCAS